jgi:hypothetical protein
MSDTSALANHHDDRRQFEPVARKYRLHGRIFMTCVLGAVVAGFLSGPFHADRSPWFVALFIICVVTGIAATLLAPPLRCPTRHADAGGELERYCPECGGSPLADSWLFARRCTSCRKRLVRGKGRHYRVRFCTNCGAYLDDAGV